ncbi:hypothetical protein DSO57_1021840 [Entomophthora muscae]|uniref:Uncharacterized protein n=1 Tax=Entomophthora muscae TaxID=34485 RepID=A0ACC2RI03_9FUNG|nr:hypothetical protein DSO57_1021840 [Entomophthora muscae]
MAVIVKENSGIIQDLLSKLITTDGGADFVIPCDAYFEVSDCDFEVFSLYCSLACSTSRHETDQKLSSLELEFSAYSKPIDDNLDTTEGKLGRTKSSRNRKVRNKVQKPLEIHVTILQNQTTLNDLGVTGTVAWNSSHYLARWILSHPEWFLGKRCLELGSGTGVVGITLGKMMSKLGSYSGSVILTDQEANLPLINKNILTNFPQASNKKGGGVDISCAELCWEDVPKLLANPNGTWLDEHPDGWDIVILSDCVYNEHLVSSLVTCLKALVSTHPTIIVLCQELRSHLVHSAFLNQLLEAEFKVVRANKINPEEEVNHIALYVMWMESEKAL